MSAKNQYNLLYFLFCLVGCCATGFIAVFLQYKGVSNTQIGVVTGTACVASIFIAPALSSLIMKIERMTVNDLLIYILLSMAVLFCGMAWLNLPAIVVMIAYSLLYCLYISAGPLIQVIASGYAQDGVEVEFGLARGLGSVAWAITAVFAGKIVDWINPLVLPVGFVSFGVFMLVLLRQMPQTKGQKREDGKKDSSIGRIIKTYPVYFLILLGFSCCMAGNTALGTYLPNIIRKLGGTTSTYGLALFVNAMSEMPVMAKASKWMKKVGPMPLCVLGGCAYFVRNLIVCLAPNLYVLFFGLLFQSISYGLLTVVVAYYVIYYLAPQDQIMGQTMIGMMTTGCGSMLGNVLGGILQDTIGLSAMFVFALICTAVGACVILRARSLEKKLQKSA
ncbi:MAG: MFS transporter [Clostridia bacterium]|nr:MFS transporter [Clostridia bacterium]